jgi:hypothetical protein
VALTLDTTWTLAKARAGLFRITRRCNRSALPDRSSTGARRGAGVKSGSIVPRGQTLQISIRPSSCSVPRKLFERGPIDAPGSINGASSVQTTAQHADAERWHSAWPEARPGRQRCQVVRAASFSNRGRSAARRVRSSETRGDLQMNRANRLTVLPRDRIASIRWPADAWPGAYGRKRACRVGKRCVAFGIRAATLEDEIERALIEVRCPLRGPVDPGRRRRGLLHAPAPGTAANNVAPRACRDTP